MPSIADLFISVSSDVSGAINGLTEVDKKVNGVSSSMQAAAPAGLALAAAAGAVGAGFLESITAASDFEHQINGIKSVMSPSEVQQFGGAIEDLALKLGKDTVFSASQAASGIEELIKAGVPLPAILDGAARAALDLAAATGIPVAQAADFASTAMNAFHKTAEQLPAVMDTIANVANGTATDVGQLQLAFSQIGPVAAGIGLSFDDTATALGIFANNGLKGSDAGTSLKTMLLNLEPSSKAQTAAFKELGLITADGANQFFDAEGKAKSMRDIFEILKTSTSNLTAEQKINLLQTAFGTDAVRAATIAAGEGAAGWDEVTASIDKMGGVQVAAQQRNSGLAGSMQALGGSFETIQITIGNLFLPVLTKLVDMLTGVLNGFLSLDPGIQTIIIAAIGIAGAIAGVVAAFVLLGPVVAAAGAGFAILAAAASPILLPLLAIAAAVAALYLAWQSDFGGIQEVTAQVWAAIQPAFVNIQNFLGTLRDTLGPAFSAASDAAAPFIQKLSELAAGVLGQLPGAVKSLGDAFNQISAVIGVLTSGGSIESLITFFERFGHDALPLADALLKIHDAFEAIRGAIALLLGVGSIEDAFRVDPAVALAIENIRNGIDAIRGAFEALAAGDTGAFFDQLGSGLSLVSDGINLLATHLWDHLVEAFNNLIPILEPIWNAALSRIGQFIQELPGIIAAAAPVVWDALVQKFGELTALLYPIWQRELETIGGWLQQLPGYLAQRIPEMWGGLQEKFGQLVQLLIPVWQAELQAIGNLIAQLPGALGAAAGNIWQYVTGSFSALPGLVVPVWETIKTNLGGLLSQLPGALVTAAGNLWGYLLGAFSALPGLAVPVWDTIKTNLGGLMSQLPGALAAAAGEVWQYLIGVFSSLPGLAVPVWNQILDNLGGLMKQLPGSLATAAGEIWQYVLGVFSSLPGLAVPVWNQILDNLGGLLGGLAGSLANAAGDVWKWFIDAAWEIGNKIGDPIQNILKYLGDAIGGIPGLFSNIDIFGGIIDQAGKILDRLGQALEPIKKYLADTFGAFWQFLTGSIALPTAPAGGGDGGTTPIPTGGGSAPLISIGTLVVASKEDADAFLQMVADAILASARRVTPPVGGANPALG